MKEPASPSVLLPGFVITPAELRNARKRLNLSVQMVADLLGVHRNTVMRWEAGAKIPGPALLSLRWVLNAASAPPARGGRRAAQSARGTAA